MVWDGAYIIIILVNNQYYVYYPILLLMQFFVSFRLAKQSIISMLSGLGLPVQSGCIAMYTKLLLCISFKGTV